MKRKNLVAMGLAGIMAVGMCMPVMAADITESTSDQKGDVTISMKQAPKYTVVIPANITDATVGETKTLEFTIKDAILAENYQLGVSAAGLSNGVLELKSTVENSNATYSVTLKDGEKAIGTDPIISLSADDAASSDNNIATKTISVVGEKNAKYAGTYEGTVTFNITNTQITQ